MTPNHPKRRVLGGLAVGLAAATLAACQAPYQAEPTSIEPRQAYPLNVESQVMSLEIVGDGQGGLLPAETLRLDRFVDEFAINGQGDLVVYTPPAHDEGGDGLAVVVAAHAQGRGLAKSEIGIATTTEAGGPVMVSFERYLVRLPECRGWNVESSFNPSNSPHVNFGCATQRNLGMMVANPAHLVAPAGQGGVLDTIRSDLVIQSYRKGELTTAEKAEELTETVSQVAE
jgi:pilus assembly protein CpaD